MRTATAREAYRWLRRTLIQRLLAVARHGRPLAAGGEVEVVGHLREATGLGESARLCARALVETGYRVGLRDLSRREEVALDAPLRGLDPARRPACRIWHLNPPLLPPAVLGLGLLRFRQGYNIGYWAWELDRLPREWALAARYMDAILVPSTFTQAVLQPEMRRPVLVVPHPLQAPPVPPGLRREYCIPPGAFLATAVFNCDSSVGRKNPLAAVQAFLEALGDREDAFLLLKTSAGQAATRTLAQLRRAAAGHPRVILVDALWSPVQIGMLLAEADVLLSLHRSEGFGLVIAEAMLRGTPVVATAWSGNVDFCPPELTCPVPARLVTVADEHPDFRNLAGQARWAEPDAAAAAAHLRTLHADRPAARRRALAARERLEAHLRTHTYGRALDRLAAGARGGNSHSAPRIPGVPVPPELGPHLLQARQAPGDSGS